MRHFPPPPFKLFLLIGLIFFAVSFFKDDESSSVRIAPQEPRQPASDINTPEGPQAPTIAQADDSGAFPWWGWIAFGASAMLLSTSLLILLAAIAWVYLNRARVDEKPKRWGGAT
jgi:hypothetical protein